VIADSSRLEKEKTLAGGYLDFDRFQSPRSLAHPSVFTIDWNPSAMATKSAATGAGRDGVLFDCIRSIRGGAGMDGRGPKLDQLEGHGRRGRHVLQAGPFERPVDFLHARGKVGSGNAEFGQARAPFDPDLGRIGGKRFIDDLAALCAIQRVGDIGPAVVSIRT